MTLESAPADSPRRLHELVSRRAAAQPDAIVMIDGARRWTYRELDRTAADLAECLVDLGVRAGDRLAVVAENCAPVVALFLAASRIDAWAVILNARLAPREIDAIVAHAGARRVIYAEGVSAEAAAHGTRHGASATDLPGVGALLVGPRDDAPAAEPAGGAPEAQVAALLYTSGTTGQPKGVMLTHGGLMFVARASARIRRIVPEDVVYAGLPLAHVFGLASVMLGSLHGGAALHLVPRFTAEGLGRALSEGGVSVLPGVPAMYARLLDYLRERGATFRAPRLRFAYAGGAPLEPALKRSAEALLGVPLHNGYGLTETSPTISMTRIDRPASDLSVGPPIEGIEIRIVDPGGADVRAGEIGELWVRGPNLMRGYYRDPALTASVMRPAGWLNTGDLARRDERGNLFIVGRTKELIIRSGFNVYPAEVEAVLGAYPAVAQCAVVGRAVEGNEEVVAFVEPRSGASVDAAALARFAAAQLAPYKRPAEIVVMPALPAAATGKILKSRLRELAARPLTSG